LVYKSIRGVTRLVGGSVDGVLGLLQPLLVPAASASSAGTSVMAEALPPPREREALLAALNGVLGDHLAATGNPLATPMCVRHAGRALRLERSALQTALPQASGQLLVLVHGLCMNDLQWRRKGHDHGDALAQELGYTPVYLHYNSGLPVHVNGLQLAQHLQDLLAAWPVPLQRVVLLGHSMGGLLIRSAMHQATALGQAWPTQVDDAVFLGTPHHGAPLERAGHWVDIVLGATPYAAPLARLGKIRSAGITDLRHGALLAPAGSHLPTPVPLPTRPRCHAVAASTGTEAGDLKHRWLGDGLVPVASALGHHADAARRLDFAADSQVVLQGLNHMDLLSNPEVMLPLRRWLGHPARA
ncbi:MAG: alpha/beta hydrolase, partial [Rubrivivax sp.]|nr:alpha/beta hydrolase [Rubrivivax sp.]